MTTPHPEMLKKIDEAVATIRNGKGSSRYLEAMIHKAFIAGYEQGWGDSEERNGDANKEWGNYEG